MNRSLSAEQDELALLRAAGEPAEPTHADLPSDRHEQLRHGLLERLTDVDAGARRRRVTFRIAAPVALATAFVAAAATLAFVTGPSALPVSGRDQDGATRSAVPGAARAIDHIRTVAYSLDRDPGEAVTITVHGFGSHAPDAGQLQRDLARMGITAQVTSRMPDCTPRIFTLAQRTADGDYVATIHPGLIDRYPETLVFSLDPDKPDPGTLTVSVGTPPGAEPTCAPLPGSAG